MSEAQTSKPKNSMTKKIVWGVIIFFATAIAYTFFTNVFSGGKEEVVSDSTVVVPAIDTIYANTSKTV
jgi:hypothetical protein